MQKKQEEFFHLNQSEMLVELLLDHILVKMEIIQEHLIDMIIQLCHLKKQYQINYKKKNIEVISVGKINDIFLGKGISKHFPSSGDANGMDITIYLATEKSNDKKN